jgi:3D (Asp-Asp-Asp) domain-containing protein
MSVTSRNLLIVAIGVGGALFVVAGFFGSYLGARRIIRPEPGTQLTVPVVAYAPSPYQTDSSPCRTASGTRVRRGTVATNFLPMGTVLRIGEDYFIVEDRMHPRYDRVIDVFKPSTAEAREFGRQTLTVTIIAYGEPGQPLPSVEDEVARAEEHQNETPNILEQWQGGMRYLQRLLKAGAPSDVNRYDENCFGE